VAEARLRGNLEQKRRIVEILEALEAGLGQLPDSMAETKAVFLRKLAL